MIDEEALAEHIRVHGAFLTPQNGGAWTERQRLLGAKDDTAALDVQMAAVAANKPQAEGVGATQEGSLAEDESKADAKDGAKDEAKEEADHD